MVLGHLAGVGDGDDWASLGVQVGVVQAVSPSLDGVGGVQLGYLEESKNKCNRKPTSRLHRDFVPKTFSCPKNARNLGGGYEIGGKRLHLWFGATLAKLPISVYS